jgi:hypothetical protein
VVAVLTKQEMFDRAVRGLRAQNWQRCVTIDESGTIRCVYYDPETGFRCAWGHVDPEGTKWNRGNVFGLRQDGVGLAAQLDHDTLPFAEQLQEAHDFIDEELPPMEQRFRLIAEQHGLTWPE